MNSTPHCHNKEQTRNTNPCCPNTEQARADWLFRVCFAGVVMLYGAHLFKVSDALNWVWLQALAHGVNELMNTMWWGIVIGVLFVGFLSRVPREFILSILGPGKKLSGLFRATLAGVMLDLCSHGILMVGMKLYERGASLGQVMTFLIASPWNSLSLTVVMVALMGLLWTLTFILLSMLIALLSGWIFERLVARGILPDNPNPSDLPDDFHFWQEAKATLSNADYSLKLPWDMLKSGIKDSKMVLKWLLFGVLLAAAIRAFVPLDYFQEYFGPTLLGLALTIVFTTVIEVCSEGSTPIAADLLNRGQAPGNSFAFLMGGVSTDYTEIMSIKETLSSWKVALFLPLVTLPQVIVVAYVLNLASP